MADASDEHAAMGEIQAVVAAQFAEERAKLDAQDSKT